MFTQNDRNQFNEKGISEDAVARQLHYFETGFPFLDLDRPATAGDGILQVDDAQTRRFEEEYDALTAPYDLLKFVPASGAATRMFKDLFAFLDTSSRTAPIVKFWEGRTKLPFYEMVKSSLQAQGQSEDDDRAFIAAVLGLPGLNYGKLPKALLHFHRYADGVRTALEEHLVEGAYYACNRDRTVRLHFTVSAEHVDGFRNKIREVQAKYERQAGVKYQITFSQQRPSTDTIAVRPDNTPFRNPDGSILFRPGGHGALLENLNDMDADIILIKNIDNVVPDAFKPDTIRYKKVLVSLLIGCQRQLFAFMRELQQPVSEERLAEVASFYRRQLFVDMPAAYASWPSERKQQYLLRLLDRPIRVCGMVRNEGEPGGGPFWVKDPDGSVSLQIAESSQIDMQDPVQASIAARATHFNPVDLVCGIKDYRGQKYDLLRFRNPDTGFITRKSKDGKELKAQELPGLWNGAMADWNTVFVEVPVSTFNPVKTVNDLLRDQHQSSI